MNNMEGGNSGQMQNFDNFDGMQRPIQGQMPMGQMQDGMQQQMSSQQMAMLQQQQQQAAAQQQAQMRIPGNMNQGMNPQANQVS